MYFDRQYKLLPFSAWLLLISLPALQAAPITEAKPLPTKNEQIEEKAEAVIQTPAPLKKSPEEEKNRLFRKNVILMSNEILEKVQKNYPNLAEKLNESDQDKLLQSLVKTLNCGLEYCPAGTEKTKKEKVDISRIQAYPAIIIAAHQVLYARLDTFSPEVIQQLRADLVSSFRLANPPSGLILDLRNAQGHQTNETLKTLGLFVKAEKLPLPEGFKTFAKEVKTPILILMGEKTSGSAELFTLLVTKHGKAMPLGEKTAGDPFNKAIIPLSNGDFLRIPKVPRYLSSVKPLAAEPTINTAAYPQIEFKKLSEEVGSEINDKCLERAIELIICLQALTPETK